MARMKTLFVILLFFGSKNLYAQILYDSLLIDGYYRSFGYNQTNAINPGGSLVFILHGSGGNGKGMMKSAARLSEQVANENVLLVYPDGYKRYWNECRKEASSLANQININENAFFDAMIDYFKKRYSINDHQVFAVGTSGGGHMCYKLALTMPGKFRAVTALIANLPDDDNMDCVESGKAIPVMIVNGTADPLNPYDGGMMEMPNFRMGKVRSTDRTFQYWAALAGYSGSPVKETIPDKDPSDGKTVERYTYKKSGKPEVVLLKVIGGKHDYPNDIDVHVEAWTFFKRQMN